MKRYVPLLCIVLLLAASLIISSCAQSSNTPNTNAGKPASTQSSPSSKSTPTSSSTTVAKTPKYGGTYKIVFPQDPVTLGYPPKVDGTSSQAVNCVCLESLLIANRQGELMPNGLATASKISPDGNSYDFTLRKGVKFHDGTPFNAQAAKWNMDQNLAAKAIGTEYWKSTEVVDENTVRLNLKQPDFTAIYNLSAAACRIISPTAFEKNGGEKGVQFLPVGTGPYKFKSYDRGVAVTYERFDDYWGGKPYLDTIVFQIIADPVVAGIALQNGDVQTIRGAAAYLAADLKAKGFTVIGTQNNRHVWLGPDSINPGSILANKKVLQALEYATNRNEIANATGYGFSVGLTQVGDPTYVASYIPDLKARNFDPVKAKQLLTEAGYPNGFKTRIFAQTETTNKDMTVAIQNQWAAVGVNVFLDYQTRAKFVEDRTKGWTDAFILISTQVTDLWTSSLDRIISIDGKAYVSIKRPPGYGEAMSSANIATDFNQYKQRTQNVVQLLFDESTVIPLFGQVDPYVAAPYVTGHDFFILPSSNWTPAKTWFDK